MTEPRVTPKGGSRSQPCVTHARAVRDSRATSTAVEPEDVLVMAFGSHTAWSDAPRLGTRESRHLRGGRRVCRSGWTSSRLSGGDKSARRSHGVPHAALGGTRGRCDRLRHIARHLAASRGAFLGLPRGRSRAAAWVVGEHGDRRSTFGSATIAGLTLGDFARQTGVDLSVERLAAIAREANCCLSSARTQGLDVGCDRTCGRGSGARHRP